MGIQYSKKYVFSQCLIEFSFKKALPGGSRNCNPNLDYIFVRENTYYHICEVKVLTILLLSYFLGVFGWFTRRALPTEGFSIYLAGAFSRDFLRTI